jgi:hypothetical protein
MVVGLAEVLAVVVTPPEPPDEPDDPESVDWSEAEPPLLLPPPHAVNDPAMSRPARA